MPKMKVTAVGLLAFLVASIGLLRSSSLPQDTADEPCQNDEARLPTRCQAHDSSVPPELAGFISDRYYCLQHASDVDAEGEGDFNLYHYDYWLKNFSSRNELTARWTKAGIDVSRTRALDCVYSYFDSSFKPFELPDTTFAYGRRLEHLKHAALYLPQEQERPPQQVEPLRARTAPSLNSGFHATVLIDSSPMTIDVETRSEFKDSQPFYQIVNRSSSVLYFSTPELVRHYGSDKFGEAVRQGYWQRFGDTNVFIVKPDSFANLLIPGEWTGRESRTQLVFHNPDGLSELASTLISVYLGI